MRYAQVRARRASASNSRSNPIEPASLALVSLILSGGFYLTGSGGGLPVGIQQTWNNWFNKGRAPVVPTPAPAPVAVARPNPNNPYVPGKTSGVPVAVPAPSGPSIPSATASDPCWHVNDDGNVAMNFQVREDADGVHFYGQVQITGPWVSKVTPNSDLQVEVWWADICQKGMETRTNDQGYFEIVRSRHDDEMQGYRVFGFFRADRGVFGSTLSDYKTGVITIPPVPFAANIPAASKTVVRTYPERRADGSVWVVTAWSDGTYTSYMSEAPVHDYPASTIA